MSPPVGDCPCGYDIETTAGSEDEWDTKPISRPWLVHLEVPKQSGEMVQCTGSLLNRYWIITAAHCFCGTIVHCNGDHMAFQKIFTGKNKDTYRAMQTVRLTLGSAEGTLSLQGMEKLVIHPEYYQHLGGTVGHTDVALIKTNQAMFETNDYNNATENPTIAPICLPPKLGYDPTMKEKMQEEEQVLQPFEDLDCLLLPGDRAVPYPYTSGQHSRGWLSCHPAGLTSASNIAEVGRTSFITAFGSTVREGAARYQCRTNSYGPPANMFDYCSTKCHTNVSQPIAVNVGRKKTKIAYVTANPSQAHPLCQKFINQYGDDLLGQQEELLGQEANLTKEGYRFDPRLHFLGWVRILGKRDKEVITCYPHKNSSELELARSMWDFPYQNGWCGVCGGEGLQGCKPRPDRGWGWCLPECSLDPDQQEADRRPVAHEAAVDSFLYENCSRTVDTSTEFCTGDPIATGYGQVWRYSAATENFTLVRNEIRSWREERESESLARDWGTGRPLRPASAYQAAQHGAAMGDSCYGDAGGSVWKFWRFQQTKLAVLTGVVSRFEEQCGVFRPDRGRHHSQPVQHTIHARVAAILDWINSQIVDGNCVQKPW